MTDRAIEAAQAHFDRRIEDLKAAVKAAGDFDAAARAGLELAASWAPDRLAFILDEAMTLAGLEGREAVWEDGEDPGEATAVEMAGEGAIRQGFAKQIDFLTQKRGKPTRLWTDAMHGDHDRAFVVAGVTDMAMLDEFQAAIIEGAKTYDIKAFGAEFDRLVEKYGWSYNGGRDWRVRTIFETNIRTSYMAGRLHQMRDPDMVKLRPYWQYVHADTRIPMVPRKDHKGWDGLLLLWNDPWWDTHFPPNDWKCSCGVRSRSKFDLKKLGKSGPDTAPETKMVSITRKATGETVRVPEGIGYGWDYMPGDRWDRGLVPSRLMPEQDGPQTVQRANAKQVATIDVAEPIEALRAKARPFLASPLSEGLRDEEYVAAFLQPFGAQIGQPVLWQDAAGAKLIISEALFQGRDGRWKLGKRGRETDTPLIAETLMDPDEIWLGLRDKPLDAFPGVVDLVVSRRYVRVDPVTGVVATFEIGRQFWEPITGFSPRNRSKPDWSYLDRLRVGKLLWKRK